MIVSLYAFIVRKYRKIKNKYFNFRFKKYIIKYEEIDNKLKIINSCDEYKYVDNTIKNKIKLMEIIKDHKEEIELKINYYENKKDDYKLILLINELTLIFLGCIFVFSFFIGDSIFFLMSLFITTMYLLIFINYLYRILIFREEIKRLKNIYEEEIYIKHNIFNKAFDTIKNILNSFKSIKSMKNIVNFK